METSRYRREYAAYCSACEGARYELYAGAASESRLSLIRERYADLWTRNALAELKRERDETPATFETQRAALHALAGAAQLEYAESRAREASDELSRCEAATGVTWDGERLGLREIPARLASESDAPRRRELGARWLDAVRSCDDLRSARLESLCAAAHELNFDSYGALHGAATNTDAEKSLAAARIVLECTAAVYESRLAAWAARSLSPDDARRLDFADEIFFARLAHLDKYFPPNAAHSTFDATMQGLGVRVGRRESLRVEESANIEAGRARCFGVRPPEDVRLVFNARAGANFYQSLFYEAGRAQQLAWASNDLASRYPEFVHAPDRATNAGFSFLFRALFSDRAWLIETRGVRASDAGEIAGACALTELHDARRAAARVIDQFELFTANDPRAESLGESFAARRHEATGFRAAPALRLFETAGAGARAAEEVRARLFAASLTEYLRTRYGRRWWRLSAAGDELVDLWNTASRYTVEELAPLAGAGGLDAELLSETLNAAAKEGE
jgi:hypothetical protein